ncbi:Hpt domain-containing protein [Acidovorax sp. SUPP2522]|uniref:hybrid sensor histidine kinase/response regulator n=1 Tax=unclassified Acidovorax TaxID=2684926 RepID=UPI00234BE060|nr:MULTISPECIES: Hpt domain-containing protein [unclassified Acidovorax]WCM98657.1 Hpt domain-containing protein [Acidovorax sp. GBBC 1281]GKT19161.1 Hpt domain-containing protein [Acidovorax sp. SUPP2522]
MSSTDAANAPAADWTQGEQDLGPLAWVLDELRKSLDGAVKAMRRFVRDAELARESDLASLDAGTLRIARQQLHQASGALEMVGMGPPALVLRAMEAAVQKFVHRPELCSDEAAGVIERASFALVEYLESVLAGKSVSPVALFPQYRDAQALAGAERVHPADLWPVERRFREPDFAVSVPPLDYGPEARARLDSAVLRIVKTGDLTAASDLRDICLAFVASQSDRQSRAFWKICAGFFEALSKGRLNPDLYVKRVASRVLMQYATLAKGDPTIADRLVQDLLFFCSQARPLAANEPAGDGSALQAVRQAFGLDRFKAVDYETPRFGLFDPALLAQARKRMSAATETWSALAGGDRNKLKPATDQFSLVCDSLSKLHPGSDSLAKALTRAVEVTTRSGEPPSPALAMEVATAVLYLQATFEELDSAHEYMADRAARLAERLDNVTAGGESAPLEPWMEELYRRVSDHQTMGSVVDELRSTLGEAEKALDQYFRSPDDLSTLAPVPGRLAQMRGVLSVLGLDQASLAVLRMRDTVERLLIGQVPESERQQVFEKLGSSLGALGFLIDMLSYQRTMARKLFVYDEELGELRILMGRTRGRATDAPEELIAKVEERGPVVAPEIVPRVEPAPKVVQESLGELAPTLEEVLELPSSAAALAEAPPAAIEPVESLPPAPAAPAPAPVAAADATQDDEEDELLDIFLEEAREVVANGLAAVDALKAKPADLSEQTTLRRAFHTLKGSSRMVGLDAFGEAAWSMEQVLNAWLAEQKPMPPALLQLSGEALRAFGAWADDIAAGDASAWQPRAFNASAEAMRDTGTFLPLAVPSAGGVVAETPAEPLPTVAEDLSETLPEIDLPAETPEVQAAPAAAETIETIEAAEAIEPATASVPVHEFDLILEDEPPMLDFADTEMPELAGAEPAPQEPAQAAAPEMAEDIDFSVFAEALAEELPPVAEAPAQEPVQDVPLPSLDDALVDAAEPAALSELSQAELADLALDLPDDLAAEALPELAADDSLLDVPELESDAAGALPDTAAHQDDLAIEPEPHTETEPEMASVRDMVEVVEAMEDGVEDVPAEPAEPVADADAEAAAQDEAVKVIETLRIGIPLYNVYLNEADEWSRRLATCLQEWALELHEPLPDTAVALAHSLAGSSATVGFHALSEMARALEHALQHVQLRGEGTADQARVFLAAADDIRRLLHQFAAGFLKEPNQQVLAELREILQTEVGSGLAALESESEALADEPAQALQELPPAEALPAEPAQVPAVEETAEADVPGEETSPEPVQEAQTDSAEAPSEPEDVPAPVARGYVAPALSVVVSNPYDDEVDAAIAHAVAQSSDIDDDIDALDVIDPDLFPIFEEEAIELLPVLGAALRQWAARPENLGARSELLRALHTLKGSSRLAGAMRLGEMAHRLESAVEQIDVEDPKAELIEPLLASFDGLQASFDALRKIGSQGLVEPVAVAPVPASERQDLSPSASAEAPEAPVLQKLPAVRLPAASQLTAVRPVSSQSVRVRAQLLDRLVNQAGEVMIARSRLDVRLGQMKGSLADLSGNLDRLRQQLRDIEVQAESQMQSRLALSKDSAAGFDPLEFDRFTRVQELTRMMAESVNDVATVQRNLQRSMEGAEDDLIAQGRQARELQRDLLRTRMVEFEGISERLYAVVRQASKETGKQIKLDISGGSIEMDRGVLDRMTPAFEHLLRNCVAHGIEAPEVRTAAGKPASGTITVDLHQEGNDVSVEFRDDGAGLNIDRIRAKAVDQGLIPADAELSTADAANLIFTPGFSTANEITGLSGRGIGMDVVRAEVNALGGRIETHTTAGQGTSFRMVLPLTTAVTQVVMLRAGDLTIGVPANLVEIVRRTTASELDAAYQHGAFEDGVEALPFFWAGALLQSSQRSSETSGKTRPVVVLRSASQRIAVHVDEVLGNQEVVVKNLGPQLSRLPGLAGMSVLASGAVVLIYNPVALSTVYGDQVRAQLAALSAPAGGAEAQGGGDGERKAAVPALSAASQVPLVLVVDDSITVRRVTQRLLQREGYRVVLAADGLQALERLQEERPTVVLSDIEMPRMDGFDLARNIRADAVLRDLPIIMITSRIAQKHREHAAELGVNHYLGKPYSDEELLSLVQHYARAAAEAAVA